MLHSVSSSGLRENGRYVDPVGECACTTPPCAFTHTHTAWEHAHTHVCAYTTHTCTILTHAHIAHPLGGLCSTASQLQLCVEHPRPSHCSSRIPRGPPCSLPHFFRPLRPALPSVCTTQNATGPLAVSALGSPLALLAQRALLVSEAGKSHRLERV